MQQDGCTKLLNECVCVCVFVCVCVCLTSPVSSPIAHPHLLVRSSLQKQQSLPVRPIVPLVARISDQNSSGAPPMTIREKTRLDKFRQLLASPNTDLGGLPVSREHSPSHFPVYLSTCVYV